MPESPLAKILASPVRFCVFTRSYYPRDLLVSLRAGEAPDGRSFLAPHRILRESLSDKQSGKKPAHVFCSQRIFDASIKDKRKSGQFARFIGENALLPHLSQQITLQLQQRVGEEAQRLRSSGLPFLLPLSTTISSSGGTHSAILSQRSEAAKCDSHTFSGGSKRQLALVFHLLELFSARHFNVLPPSLQAKAVNSQQQFLRQLLAHRDPQEQEWALAQSNDVDSSALFAALWRLRLWLTA